MIPSAKLRINSVEGVAKAGDETKVDFFTGGNGDDGDELNTPFPLLSPVKRGFFAYLASWRDKRKARFSRLTPHPLFLTCD